MHRSGPEVYEAPYDRGGLIRPSDSHNSVKNRGFAYPRYEAPCNWMTITGEISSSGRWDMRKANTLIPEAFHRTGAVEVWGRGANRVIDACRRHGAAPPTFKEDQGFVVVTFMAEIVAGAASVHVRDQVGTKSGPRGNCAALPTRTTPYCHAESRRKAKSHQVPRQRHQAFNRGGIVRTDGPRQTAKPSAKVPDDRGGDDGLERITSVTWRGRMTIHGQEIV